MRRDVGLVNVLLVSAAATLVAACGSSASHGTVHIAWSLVQSGTVTPCPDGFSMRATSVESATPTDAMINGFTCSEGAGNLRLSLGSWRTTLELIDDRNVSLWSTSFTSEVSSDVVTNVDAFRIAFLGSLSMTWTLTAAGSPTTCAAQGVTTLRFSANRVGASGETDMTDFQCSAMEGKTGGTLVGSYDQIGLQLLDSSFHTIKSVSVPGAFTVTGDQNVDLGSIVFAF